jgi:hypothetical protein
MSQDLAAAINDGLYNYEDELWDPSDDEAWVCPYSRVVDPDWESGSRGKKIKKFRWKNELFSFFKKCYHLKGKKIGLTSFWNKILMNNTGIFI